ncbi:MAG: hypothetical protein WCS72_13445 [Deltaproteobacteria bacterium]
MSEKPIIRALTALGCSVQPLSGKGVPDLLVSLNGRMLLMECKAPAGPLGGVSGRGLTKDQQKWWRTWQTPIWLCRTVDHAIAVAVQELGIQGRLVPVPTEFDEG